MRRVADDREVARFEAGGFKESGLFRFSPDGRYLAIAESRTGVLTVFEVDRNAIAIPELGPVAGTAARFSPDSRRIALAHRDGSLLVYDLETRQPRRLRSGLGPVRDLAFRSDGLQIAVTTDGLKPKCHIIEVDRCQVVRTILLRSVSSVAWSPDGDSLATGGDHDVTIVLWDTASGIARAWLEGSSESGVHAAFHPSGTLLASNCLDARLRLWDAVLGRQVQSVTGSDPEGHSFLLVGGNGQIVVESEGRLTTYQIDPALEFRTLAHVSGEPMFYGRPSIRRDNRLLAVGSNTGVVLWDLARGTDCGFPPIGPMWHILFEPSGDLLTSGPTGMRRWPVRLDFDRNEFRIGPPSDVPLSKKVGQVVEDRTGRIIASARGDHAEVLQRGHLTRVEPMVDCRCLALHPDGEWLATGSDRLGAQIWRVRDVTKVCELPVDTGKWVTFSPDGKWLLTGNPPCKLWATGTWALARELGGAGLCFSPDSRLVAVLDASQMVRLVEVDTGRVLARLERPEASNVLHATFSPDGSRLVLVPLHTPVVQVWDLGAIRKRLGAMDLDWDAPALPDDDGAFPARAPLPPLQIDFGPLASEIEPRTESPPQSIDRYTARVRKNPNDEEAWHHRGHAFYQQGRFKEAADDLSVAVGLRPDDAHLREALAESCNLRARELLTGPRPAREVDRALEMARRAVELVPNDNRFENTLGVALYRACQYPEAIETLERRLASSRGQHDAFDFLFLAMAHHRQGQRDRARACFDQAVRWMANHQKGTYADMVADLAALRAEAEAVLAGNAGELPDDVFAPGPEKPLPKRQ